MLLLNVYGFFPTDLTIHPEFVISDDDDENEVDDDEEEEEEVGNKDAHSGDVVDEEEEGVDNKDVHSGDVGDEEEGDKEEPSQKKRKLESDCSAKDEVKTNEKKNKPKCR